LNLGSACPITDVIDISTSSLEAFTDDTFSSQSSVFAASSIAYFGATVDSLDAVILSKQLQSVCFVHNGGSCQNLDFTLESSVSLDPAFSVNLAPLYLLATPGGEPVSIHALITLEWADNVNQEERSSPKKMDVALNFQIELISSEVSSEESAVNSAIKTQLSIFALFCIVLLALF